MPHIPMRHSRRPPLDGRLQFIVAFAVFCAAGNLAGCGAAPSNKGRTIVLVGASSGLGKGVAQKLADQGANVVVAARRTELIDALAADCERRGGGALAVTTDISRADDAERLAQAAVEQFGKIDVWINFAGIGAYGRFEDIPLEDHHRLVDVNVKGVINGSHVAMRQFRKQRRGTLINISSIAGRIGVPYHASYAASKFAVTGLGLALNQEVRLSGMRDIKICNVYPYATDTPFFDHAANYSGHYPYLAGMDPPGPVVDLIVRMTTRPVLEAKPNIKTSFFLASHRVNRRVTENLTGSTVHESIIGNKMPAPTTQGSLYEPVPEGTGVSGGVRRRMKVRK